MAISFLLKRSNTASKRPTAAQLDIGELSLNYEANTAGVFFEDSAGNVRKVGPAEVSSTAPNSSPAGSSGNSLGELWYDTNTSNLKIWTGASFVNATAVAGAGGSNTQVQYNSGGTLTGSSNFTFDGTTASIAGLAVTGSSIFRAGATQDGVAIAGRAGGTGSYEVTLTPTTLSADRTQTLQDAAGTIALSGNKLSFFAATTSAELAGVISDETGSGSLVFGTSPAITTSLTTGSASFDLINTTATTVNFAGAATTLTIGATSGTTTVRNDFNRSGNISAAAWTTGGISIDSVASTFTDTSSGGGATVASRVAVSCNTPTFASSNAITVTNAANFYISAAPSAGSGTTITNAYALWVDAGTSRFDGDVLPGADNTLNLGNASFRWANVYTGDLHLKNDRGDYTIIEEEDALTLRNNKTGKVYNFVLQERV